MNIRFGKFVFGLLIGLSTVTVTLGADFDALDVALPKGGDTIKYAPVFDFDGDGCLPSAGISRQGEKNPGLKPTGSITGQCRTPYFLPTSNTLHRYACITSGGSNYCGHFYSLYFEKDQCYEGQALCDPVCGHRHDWEYAAVWTQDGFVTHGSVSAHGELETKSVTEAPFEDGHLKVVYHKDSIWTHAMRFAKSGETAENVYQSFVTPPIISWYELTGDSLSNNQMRDKLNSFCYNCDECGGGTIPLKDSTFLNNLNRFKPSSYPDFTHASVEAANPNKAVLTFVEGDGFFFGEDSEYFLDFGEISLGRHRMIAELAVMNGVFEPADNLDGDFDTTSAAPYLSSGFNSFTGLASGGFIEDNVVEIPTAGYWPGVVTGEIVLQPKGLVDTGERVPLEPITLTMSMEIVPASDDGGGNDDDNFFGCTVSPNLNRRGFDPTLIFFTMIAMLYMGMRRRNAHH